MSTAEQRAHWLSLSRMASAGPWSPGPGSNDGIVRGPRTVYPNQPEQIANCNGHEANTEFLAAARDAIPLLLADVDRLERRYAETIEGKFSALAAEEQTTDRLRQEVERLERDLAAIKWAHSVQEVAETPREAQHAAERDTARTQRDALRSAFCDPCAEKLIEGARYSPGTCLHCQGEAETARAEAALAREGALKETIRAYLDDFPRITVGPRGKEMMLTRLRELISPAPADAPAPDTTGDEPGTRSSERTARLGEGSDRGASARGPRPDGGLSQRAPGTASTPDTPTRRMPAGRRPSLYALAGDESRGRRARAEGGGVMPETRLVEVFEMDVCHCGYGHRKFSQGYHRQIRCHRCQEWTWADGNFCTYCGDRLKVDAPGQPEGEGPG